MNLNFQTARADVPITPEITPPDQRDGGAGVSAPAWWLRGLASPEGWVSDQTAQARDVAGDDRVLAAVRGEQFRRFAPGGERPARSPASSESSADVGQLLEPSGMNKAPARRAAKQAGRDLAATAWARNRASAIRRSPVIRHRRTSSPAAVGLPDPPEKVR